MSAVRQTQLRAGTWNFDAVHSQVVAMVPHMSMAVLTAKFPKVSGALEVDADDPLRSRFEIEIDATAVTTGHPAQEDFIKGEPWLDVEHHPTISFTSTAIEPMESGYQVTGRLTLRGVTREVRIPAEFQGVISDPWGLRAGFTSRITINRRDFGITWNRTFDWGVMAGEQIDVILQIELAYPDESLAQKPT